MTARPDPRPHPGRPSTTPGPGGSSTTPGPGGAAPRPGGSSAAPGPSRPSTAPHLAGAGGPAAGPPAEPAAVAEPGRPALADRQRRRDLVRMKSGATALLLVAAAVYLVARRAEDAGAPGWVGFVRAAAEAGMVGGLADWFAVTALFRRPLGLPIPHTAIIPTRKDALGHNLSDFVGANFLSEQVVRDRLARAEVTRRLGRWLAEPAHAERVSTELAAVLRGAVAVLRDEDVRAVVEPAVLRRLADLPVGPWLGRLLAEVVEAKAHRRLVDLVVTATEDWLRANRGTVVEVVMRQAPSWSPEFLDRQVASRVHAELLRVAGEVRADQEHPIRAALDRLLARLADDLRNDPATGARASALLTGLLEREEVRRAFGDVIAAGRRLLLEMVDDPTGELRTRVTAGLADLGRRLDTDEALRARVDAWIADVAGYVVTHYRDELTRTITDTVERWDGVETARKVELQVGRDLQFIRINGTVVGALAGVAIHAAGLAL